MNVVVQIRPSEKITLDEERLDGLYQQLGEAGAESVVSRAMEELAVRLSQCSMLWQRGHAEHLRKNARSLIAIADQIGMSHLALVARDVTACIDLDDEIAVAATLSRMLRIGERSLTAIWSFQDIGP
ncbi:hypothetical protein [uncultured Sulfitobacter sp.]|uniref:hypothetical protein n=1 Tax=uncultured Sulfitobacter sp. TaxID=191468 RepID=UPI002622F853|nr:hypothetical protein [uncultured Sulfitobacter sp.]